MPEDCILYSKDGAEFKIHKDIFSQTEFMKEILKSVQGYCCCKIEIICPCTKEELEKIVHFLCTGEMKCEELFDSFTVQEDLNKIFGFPENLTSYDQNDKFSSILGESFRSKYFAERVFLNDLWKNFIF